MENTGESLTRDESLTLIPLPENTSPTRVNNSMAHSDLGNHGWIIDSGETDHMTFDSRNLLDSTQSKHTCIFNSNGVTYPVERAKRVTLAPILSLQNTLLVFSLLNKLLSLD